METLFPKAKNNQPTLPKLTVDTTELAWMLGVSRPFCYQLINREDFPKSFRIGSKRLHSVAAVQEWINKQVQEAD